MAALAGAIVFPGLPALAGAPAQAPQPLLAAPAETEAAALQESVAGPAVALQPKREGSVPSESCLAETICAVKERVRWKTTGWTPSYCQLIAKGVLSAAAKYDLPPALLMAVMMNESDLNEHATLETLKGNALYAKDSGLMGIRCVVDKKGRCMNGNVRGLSWKTVMDPVKNIELGARELAHYRDGGGVSLVTVRQRVRGGHVIERTKYVPCAHKTHAYWAHYNHGPRYIDSGHARHYPHRIAVLYYALANAMNLPAPELRARVTISDPGKRQRTADRPVEARYRILCDKIRSVRGTCAAPVAAADARKPIMTATTAVSAAN